MFGTQFIGGQFSESSNAKLQFFRILLVNGIGRTEPPPIRLPNAEKTRLIGLVGMGVVVQVLDEFNRHPQHLAPRRRIPQLPLHLFDEQRRGRLVHVSVESELYPAVVRQRLGRPNHLRQTTRRKLELAPSRKE